MLDDEKHPFHTLFHLAKHNQTATNIFFINRICSFRAAVCNLTSF